MKKLNQTRDFVEWLSKQKGLYTAKEMTELYRPLNGENDFPYDYEVVKRRNYFVVKGGTEELILTEQTKRSFIKYLDSLYDLGVEGQVMFDHAMERDD